MNCEFLVICVCFGVYRAGLICGFCLLDLRLFAFAWLDGVGIWLLVWLNVDCSRDFYVLLFSAGCCVFLFVLVVCFNATCLMWADSLACLGDCYCAVYVYALLVFLRVLVCGVYLWCCLIFHLGTYGLLCLLGVAYIALNLLGLS